MRRKTTGLTYAVVLAGGKGKRLRPLSSDTRPKAFLSVTKDRKTIFRNTLDRVARLIPPERIVVVANRMHSRLVKKDLAKASRRNLILEPVSRNTAPAIALAARAIKLRDEDAVMLVLPTDHYVPGEDKQLAAIKKGIDFIKNGCDAIAVIGLKPKRASTGFGYIKVSKPEEIAKVRCFTEKPDKRRATRYVSSGDYLWNTGIFIFKARTLLKALKRYAPKIFRILNSKDINKSYRRMPDISLDYAILEKARNIYCVSGSYDWNDIGSFEALRKVLARESRRFVEKDGKIIKII